MTACRSATAELQRCYWPRQTCDNIFNIADPLFMISLNQIPRRSSMERACTGSVGPTWPCRSDTLTAPAQCRFKKKKIIPTKCYNHHTALPQIHIDLHCQDHHLFSKYNHARLHVATRHACLNHGGKHCTLVKKTQLP